MTETVHAASRTYLAFVHTAAPTAAIGVLTAYNFWTGYESLQAAGTETSDGVSTVIRYTLDTWRTALCAEAAAADAVCIDVYAAFNGPDGQQVPETSSPPTTRTHPSSAMT